MSRWSVGRAAAGWPAPEASHDAAVIHRSESEMAPRDRDQIDARPNLFFIGYPKCGTTALYEYLKDHPDISVGAIKEPWFFGSDFRQEYQQRGFWDETSLKTVEQYLALFDSTRPYRADFTPGYIYSTTAAREIHQFNPDARLVLCLREPVDYLFSAHGQAVKKGAEPVTDFRRALALEAARQAGRHVPKGTATVSRYLYSEQVRYATHLRRYLDVFPVEQIKVVLFDDFRADNQAVVDDICAFLSLPGIRLDDRSANVRQEVRFGRMRHGVLAVYRQAAPLARRCVPAAARRGARRMLDRLTLTAGRKRIDPALRRELTARFKPEVEAVDQLLHETRLLQRDLVRSWGYDAA